MTSRLIFRALMALLTVSLLPTRLPAQAVTKVPILDDASYVVIRVRLDKVDVAGLGKWVDERIQKSVPENGKASIQQDVAGGMQQAAARIKGLLDAGSNTAYMSFASFPPNQPSFYFAKTGNGDIAKLVTAVEATIGVPRPMPANANAPDNQLVIAPLGDGVFAGTAKDYRHFQQNAVGAPQLTFRLSTLPDTAVQAVAMPTDAVTQTLEALPNIPAPINEPMTTITQGISSMTLSGDLPPKFAAEVIVTAPDAEKAKALETLVKKFNQLYGQAVFKRVFPDVDVQKVVDALTPKLQPDNTLVMKVEGGEVSDALGTMFITGLLQARQSAQLVQSASMLRQQVMAVIMYQNQKKVFPDTLKQVVDAGLIGPAALKNPRGATPAEDYLYRKPAGGNNPNQIIVYENPDDIPPGSMMINAGFADGHVEALRVQDLKARLGAP